MMGYMIDAWLDSAKPSLRVLDKDSGEEVLYFGADDVRRLLDDGELCQCDLDSMNDGVLVDVIESLFRNRHQDNPEPH